MSQLKSIYSFGLPFKILYGLKDHLVCFLKFCKCVGHDPIRNFHLRGVHLLNGSQKGSMILLFNGQPPPECGVFRQELVKQKV